jgi:uncharacterized membrane protein YjjP (DUF1212 family)
MTTMIELERTLDREALRDVIDLALWSGQLLLQHGAESARVEETVHKIGTGLGANWMDILVSPNVIIATTISGEEFRTKVRRVIQLGVNMTIVAEVNDLSRRVVAGQLDRRAVRAELERISRGRPHYSRAVTILAAGFGCAAFSQLFGGDAAAFAITFVAASAAMWLRQTLLRERFNPLLVVIITAFAASALAAALPLLAGAALREEALIASVLLLVPGIHLLNAAEDVIAGHLITGIARGFLGVVISLCIALGLLLALRLLGINAL